MSFILDALKKSESERQRRREPAVADIPYGRPRRSQTVWMVAIVVLLLVNLGALVFMLRPQPAQPPATPAASAQPTPPPAAPATPPATLSAAPAQPAEVRPLATEASTDAVDAEDQTATLESPDEPQLVRSIAAPPRSPAPQTGNVPTLAALGGAGALNLPELRLDIHVYSATPAERFVFINMRKYSEGQAITEGPTVQRIASDGVVLNYGDRQFLLPRQ